MKVQTRLKAEKKKGVVYEISCQNCAQVYICETGWTLKIAYFRAQTNCEAIWWQERDFYTHFQTRPLHNVWDEATVSTLDSSYWRQRVHEAINIRTKKEVMNFDSGLIQTHSSHSYNNAEHLADSAFSIFHSTHHFVLFNSTWFYIPSQKVLYWCFYNYALSNACWKTNIFLNIVMSLYVMLVMFSHLQPMMFWIILEDIAWVSSSLLIILTHFHYEELLAQGDFDPCPFAGANPPSSLVLLPM